MPCRPPEYDLSLRDGERAEAQVTALLEHRHRLRRVLQAYAADAPNVPRALREALHRFVSEEIPVLPPRPEDDAGRYATPEHGNWALLLLYLADQQERTLCEGRTLLVQLAAAGAPTSDVRAELDAQIAAHRDHRRDDLEEVRRVLRRCIDALERSEVPRDAELADLRAQLARAQELSVDEILGDRAPLDALWPKR